MEPQVKVGCKDRPTAASRGDALLADHGEDLGALLGDIDYTTGATLRTRHCAYMLGIKVNADAFHTPLHTRRKTGLFHAQAG